MWNIRASAVAFPRSLPGEPWAVDPATGKPMVYRKTQSGFELYSVGPNGKDDGGEWSASGKRTDDIQFNAATRSS